MKLLWFISSYLALILIPFHSLAETNKPLRWYGYVYGGKMIEDNFVDIPGHLTSLDYKDSKLIAAGIGKELYHFRDYLTFEGEGQIAHHLGEINNHTELNALINLRWQLFPWDKWLDTSLALGGGISFATDKPQIEIEDGDEAEQTLLFLSAEADFIIPKQEDWSVFTRVHHRSGAFGAFSPADGTSNAVAVGFKKRF